MICYGIRERENITKEKQKKKKPSKRKLPNAYKLHKLHKTSAPTLGRSLKAQPTYPRHPLFNFNGFTRQVGNILVGAGR